MKTITKKCETCNNEFKARVAEVNRGNGKFCSRGCFYAYNAEKQKAHPKSNCFCSKCGVEFYKKPSKFKNSRSGLFFCSRKCKDEAQRVGGISGILPDHYGTGHGSESYRIIAFLAHGKVCRDCGYDEISECLEVHHIDRNRKHNDKENLVVLCPTCHQVRHFKERTGRWSRKTQEVA